MNLQSDKEIWKKIPDFEGYEVSNFGQVRSFFGRGHGRAWKLTRNPQRILAQGEKKNGYKFVCLVGDSKRYSRTVHRLVMLAFVGSCPKGMEVCHNDSDPANNRLDNLRYDTHFGNMKDYSNKMTAGELNLKQINEIKVKFQAGQRIKKIARDYYVTPAVVRLALSMLRGEPRKRTGRSPLITWEERNKIAKEIRTEYARGNLSYTGMVEKYNLNISNISRIINGISAKDAGGPIKGIDY